jgi:acetyl-CoA synthetase
VAEVNNEALENLSFESRIYEPTKEFASNANAQETMYAEAKEDRLKFWEKQANRLTWETPWTKTLDWANAPWPEFQRCRLRSTQ